MRFPVTTRRCYAGLLIKGSEVVPQQHTDLMETWVPAVPEEKQATTSLGARLE